SVPSAGGDFFMLLAGLRLCPTLAKIRSGPVLEACASGELGRMQGAGTHLRVTESQAAFWGALGGGLRLSFPFCAGVGLPVIAEALLPLHRPDFVLLEPDGRPAENVHRASWLAGRISVGVEFHLETQSRSDGSGVAQFP